MPRISRGGRGAFPGSSRTSDLAPATANRWLIVLAKRGLLTRRASPYCERGVLVALTDEGAKRLRDYLTVAHRLSPWLS